MWNERITVSSCLSVRPSHLPCTTARYNFLVGSTFGQSVWWLAYRLDDSESESRQWQNFYSSEERPYRLQGTPTSSPYNTEVKNECSCTSSPPISFHDMDKLFCNVCVVQCPIYIKLKFIFVHFLQIRLLKVSQRNGIRKSLSWANLLQVCSVQPFCFSEHFQIYHTQYMLLTGADDLLCLQLHTVRSPYTVHAANWCWWLAVPTAAHSTVFTHSTCF